MCASVAIFGQQLVVSRYCIDPKITKENAASNEFHNLCCSQVCDDHLVIYEYRKDMSSFVTL